jgi:hypothetical protein
MAKENQFKVENFVSEKLSLIIGNDHCRNVCWTYLYCNVGLTCSVVSTVEITCTAISNVRLTYICHVKCWNNPVI